ncbi:Transcription factor BIM2 [Zostera marina]|uniref:Transcription factor BIM2 n=1 Tax=Zostera marina TaxID=29655 RepID=A0A0K9NQM6_ZOSMR|nr:Transcription factor BIM2 [Zostera marina]
MDSGSKSGKGFTDEDEDDEEFGRREGSSLKELTVKTDRRGNQNNNQKASTPRSKHSATEQRRRSKINDRFQILRELIPQSDQKRDKASFLLEVIEYVQFLHDKLQKYEAGFHGWGQESTKLIPWKHNQVLPIDSIGDHSQTLHGSSASRFVFSGDNAIPVAPVQLTNDHSQLEPLNVNSGLPHKESSLPSTFQQYSNSRGVIQPLQRLSTDLENIASQSQSQCLRQCSGSASDNVVNEEELTIDEGTISISSAYSEGLLNALTESLQNSGIDLSQASVSVKINLGKRAFSRSGSNPKDHEDPSFGNQVIGQSQMGSTIDIPERANKRPKPDKS